MPIRSVLRPVIAGMAMVVVSTSPGLAGSAQAPATPTLPGPQSGLRVSSDVSTIRVQNQIKASRDAEASAETSDTTLGTTPVNGIGGTGGGRYTFKPAQTSQNDGGTEGTSGFQTGSTPVNGVGGTGGGRMTGSQAGNPETEGVSDFVNVDSSNRDHIDQDAQTDIKK